MFADPRAVSKENLDDFRLKIKISFILYFFLIYLVSFFGNCCKFKITGFCFALFCLFAFLRQQ